MTIKMRLVFSYIAMTFIPVVLFALIAGSLSSFFFKDAAAPHGGFGFPGLWETAKQRDELVAGVKFMAQTDPDRFTDSRFLKNTDEQLNHWQAGLVVKKDNQTTYVSPYVNTSDLANKLRTLRTEPDQSPWGKRWNNRTAAETFEITFSDHSAGTVYVLSDANTFFQNARLFFPLLVLSLLIVIGLTNGILTFLVSRSFIKPLYKLQHAAVQIKEGNLDHEVNLNRKDEIGELGEVFEEMRSRLKESIRLQLQYEENRKELVSNISHDLKTPITGIKACLEGIRDGIADTGPKREKYMNMIAKKTEEMDRLIDELMLYSKLDLNRLPFHLEPVELAAYLRDCVEEFSVDPRMEGTQITFTNVCGRPISVLADREKLHRVLLNIIDNSLKYMNQEPKEIQVELFEGDAEATVRIQDNGPGIESAALPHIFERFYRAESSRSTATGGSGLGLAIVSQIIQGQGGTVWAESQPGEGTSISFTLPQVLQGGEET